MSSQRLRNLDLGTLRSLVTIAESGSMTRAAARLFMTQSAISMQIKRLENHLGFRVLERSPQGMTPTAEGQQLLHYAERLLAINDEAMGRLTSPDYEGQIRFGAPGDIIYPHIPAVLRDFSRDYPRVRVQLTSSRSMLLKKELRQGLQDVVLTTEPAADEGGEVISTRPLLWTGAADGTAWKRRPLPIGFARTCAFRGTATRALDEAGIEWIDAVNSDDASAAEAMTAADLCIAAELESAVLDSRVPVEHGGQLPALPPHSIVLYAGADLSAPLLGSLCNYLRRAFE